MHRWIGCFSLLFIKVPSIHMKTYISITGLKPKGVIGFFKFWRLAIPSFQQAKKADGNTFCEVKRMKGFQCTLTAWKSREDMLNYLRSGAHLVAMKSFSKIAIERTYGFESEAIPTWEEAIQLLLEKGKEH